MKVSKQQQRDSSLKKLQEESGYLFKDRALLEMALTHASATVEKSLPHNERLEFLGDRVLGAVISDFLYQAYPEANEGELSRRFNALVKRETCAEAARNLSIVVATNTGRSMSQKTIEKSTNVLANICEALIGAIHRDGGFEESRRFILKLWQPFFSREIFQKDAKTELQEWALAKKIPIPSYKGYSKKGLEHAPTFEVEVSVLGYASTYGEGTSKRRAEQKAAEKFLITYVFAENKEKTT